MKSFLHFKQANFILFDPVQKEVTTQSHHELFSRIKRPKDCSVFNQTVLICTVPEQDPDVIADIEKAGLELRITAYRPSDNKMSKTRYDNTVRVCIIMLLTVDHDNQEYKYFLYVDNQLATLHW